MEGKFCIKFCLFDKERRLIEEVKGGVIDKVSPSGGSYERKLRKMSNGGAKRKATGKHDEKKVTKKKKREHLPTENGNIIDPILYTLYPFQLDTFQNLSYNPSNIYINDYTSNPTNISEENFYYNPNDITYDNAYCLYDRDSLQDDRISYINSIQRDDQIAYNYYPNEVLYDYYPEMIYDYPYYFDGNCMITYSPEMIWTSQGMNIPWDVNFGNGLV